MKDDGWLQGPVVHAVHHRLEGTLKVNRHLVRRVCLATDFQYTFTKKLVFAPDSTES